jgi:hypothetical protein
MRRPDGSVAIEAHEGPLQGVSTASQQATDIAISVGDRRSHLTHEIHDVDALQRLLTPDEADRALIVHCKDGSTTTIEFRSPMRPEDVDGLPASDLR